MKIHLSFEEIVHLIEITQNSYKEQFKKQGQNAISGRVPVDKYLTKKQQVNEIILGKLFYAKIQSIKKWEERQRYKEKEKETETVYH